MGETGEIESSLTRNVNDTRLYGLDGCERCGALWGVCTTEGDRQGPRPLRFARERNGKYKTGVLPADQITAQKHSTSICDHELFKTFWKLELRNKFRLFGAITLQAILSLVILKCNNMP